MEDFESSQKQPVGFEQLLDAAASDIKKEGTHSVELTAPQVKGLMLQVFEQSTDALKQQGATAQIDFLNVSIFDGKGKVETKVTVSKSLVFLSPSATFNAILVLENAKYTPVKVETTTLEVSPETVFMVFQPREQLFPYLGGQNINETFMKALSSEMQKRGAKLDGIGLTLADNILKVDLKGTGLT